MCACVHACLCAWGDSTGDPLGGQEQGGTVRGTPLGGQEQGGDRRVTFSMFCYFLRGNQGLSRGNNGGFQLNRVLEIRPPEVWISVEITREGPQKNAISHDFLYFSPECLNLCRGPWAVTQFKREGPTPPGTRDTAPRSSDFRGNHLGGLAKRMQLLSGTHQGCGPRGQDTISAQHAP